MTDRLDAVIEWPLADIGATRALARAAAGPLARGDVVALGGALGTGKTTFTRFLITALSARAGVPAPAEVPSPTYTLVQVYDVGPLAVWHLDLYRLERPLDALELGIEEAFTEALVVIEWPERLGPYLPDERLDITFARDLDGTRKARITGHGARGRALVRPLAASLGDAAATAAKPGAG